MRAKGWDFPVDEYGGIDANLDEVGGADRVIADIDECYSTIPAKYHVEVDADYLRDVLYPQQVDTYDCLVAHGVEPAPPPPVDVFVETHLSEDPALYRQAWIAWGGQWVEVFLDSGHEWADLVQLERDCPQPYVAP
jgi:hypothetical protein